MIIPEYKETLLQETEPPQQNGRTLANDVKCILSTHFEGDLIEGNLIDTYWECKYQFYLIDTYWECKYQFYATRSYSPQPIVTFISAFKFKTLILI